MVSRAVAVRRRRRAAAAAVTSLLAAVVSFPPQLLCVAVPRASSFVVPSPPAPPASFRRRDGPSSFFATRPSAASADARKGRTAAAAATPAPIGGDSSGGGRFLLGEGGGGGGGGCAETRREFASSFLSSVGALSAVGIAAAVAPNESFAAEGNEDDPGPSSSDLTSRLFNPDGSLRDSALGTVKTEAASRTVTSVFPSSSSGGAVVSVDGSSVPSSSGEEAGGGAGVRLSYKIPEKWTPSGPDLYVDKSEGIVSKAADRITVYSPPGSYTIDTLKNAATTGIAKALSLSSVGEEIYNPSLEKADLVGGRTRRDSTYRTYYDFDIAVAPKTCGKSAENLGLGFCPYDSIVLLSATVSEDDGRLYVVMVECDKDEWRRSNSDLKRVRSSFAVEEGS